MQIIFIIKYVLNVKPRLTFQQKEKIIIVKNVMKYFVELV